MKINEYFDNFKFLNRFRSRCKSCPKSNMDGHDCAFPDCSPFIWEMWYMRAHSVLALLKFRLKDYWNKNEAYWSKCIDELLEEID